jgi:omega-amidase
MKISLIQFAPKWENKFENKKKTRIILKKKSNLGEIIVFPEMTLTGFTMNTSAMAEDLRGDTIAFFSGIAKKNNADVFAGIIEKSGRNYFNTLVHLDGNGKLKARYRKIHPFSYSTEDKFYRKGDKVVITKVDKWKIGLSICYDLRFPELFRLYAKKRVDLIINIANWPETRNEHWRTLLKARAIENQCYVVGVNRVGDDPKLHYIGFSSVFDPTGKEVIAQKNKEKILTADISQNYVEEVREKLPFLNDIQMI